MRIDPNNSASQLVRVAHGRQWLRWSAVFLLALVTAGVAAQEVSYIYDNAGRLRQVVHPGGVIKRYKLDPAGNRSTVDVIVTSPPSVPANPTATGGSEQISLSWSASTAAAETTLGGYKIFRGGVLLATTTGTATTYVDRPLPAQTTYTYTVAAYNTFGGISAQSTSVSGTTLADTIAPSVPTGVQGSPGVFDISLTWTASTDTGGSGLSGYRISRNGTQIGTSSTPSYADSDLIPNTTYSYTVAAVDNANNVSAASTAASVTTQRSSDAAAPSVPTNLLASFESATKVNLSWIGSTDSGGSGLKGYRLYRDGTLHATITTTTYADTPTPEGTAHSYRVSAYDRANNESARSAAIVPLDSLPPGQVFGVATTSVSSNEIAILWSAPGDLGGRGVNGYDVYVNGSFAASKPVGDLTYVHRGLSPSTTYAFVVRAVDGLGNVGPGSDSLSVTTLAGLPAPSPPANLSLSLSTPLPPNSPRVTLTWTSVTGATSYEAWETMAFGTPTRIYAGTALTTVFPTQQGAFLSFYVTACNANGCSAASVVRDIEVPCAGGGNCLIERREKVAK